MLPGKYCSGSKIQKSGQLVDLDKLYGYSEFLYTDADKDIATSKVAKDLKNRIFKNGTTKETIEEMCEKFYGIFGQYFALAHLYSLTDLTEDNVQAHKFEPYLIDLEASCIMKSIKPDGNDGTCWNDGLTKKGMSWSLE